MRRLTANEVSDFVSQRETQEGKARAVANAIVGEVREKGWAALQAYSEKFDRVKIEKATVYAGKEEIEKAYFGTDAKLLGGMRKMIANVREFARVERESIKAVALRKKGLECTLVFRPVERAGIYVPAGRAPLFSSLIMAAMPAKIAGVDEIIVCTPPSDGGRPDRRILAAARLCGISKIYAIGGAQAIAAMAYGIDGVIPKVDVICGPGNAYVCAAKQAVLANSGARIDIPAGPSEVLVIVGETAKAKEAAADMLAQAEHGADSSAICICMSRKKANEVRAEVQTQLGMLAGSNAARLSIGKWGRIFFCESIGAAIEAANRIAPEHLELLVRQPEKIVPKIRNAGAIFLGTGEAFCDYGMGGGNHILPTGGAARAWSGVSVKTFGKFVYVEKISRNGQRKLAPLAGMLAEAEGLEAHAKAARIRCEDG